MTVGANVGVVRRSRGLTCAQLAERVAACGRPIPANGIGRLEVGKRRIDVDDLFALALCLNVTTSALMVPTAAEVEQP